MMKNWMRWLTAVFAALLLAACGGGGGGTGGFGGGGGGAGGGGAVTASDLVVSLSKPTLSNSGTDTLTLTITALDAGRNTLAGAAVTVTVDNDGIAQVGGAQTGTTGQLVATISAGDNRSDRVITATIRSGSVTEQVAIQVGGTDIRSTLVPGAIGPGATGSILYTVLDASETAFANQAVTITAPGLTPPTATGTTNANGQFTFNFTAPSPTVTPQTITVSARAAGVEEVTSFTVNPAAVTPPAVSAGTVIAGASLTANPVVVTVNPAGDATNQAALRALVVGVNNSRIENVRVRFAVDITNSPDGVVNVGSTVLFTDVDGVASAAFVPGGRSSPTQGVTVRACFGRDDAEIASRPCNANYAAGFADTAEFPRSLRMATVRLTVRDEPLNVSIGTNELIDPSSTDGLAYEKSYLVTVVDSAGQPRADVQLSAIIDLVRFRKGVYTRPADRWEKTGALPSGDEAICNNEDVNRNGIIEPGIDLIPPLAVGEAPEAYRLRPGAADVQVILDNARTRVDGTAILRIRYAKSFGSWVDLRINVSASGVSGTEGRATYLVAPTPVDAASITAETTPAFAQSPYGEMPGCNNRD